MRLIKINSLSSFLFRLFKKSGGFTLVELLVVIAVIGLLSSVVLASLTASRRKSRDARRVSDMRQVQIAFEFYFDVTRAYPANGYAGLSAILAPTYIATVPSDPLVGWPGYRYCQRSVTSYTLGASLENTPNVLLANDVDINYITGNCTGVNAINGGDAVRCDGTGGGGCYATAVD
ncbi:MAG: prepilin-type N-terminal cleavage/methylation domain-containing protein [Patescibacteria group bacterium]